MPAAPLTVEIPEEKMEDSPLDSIETPENETYRNLILMLNSKLNLFWLQKNQSAREVFEEPAYPPIEEREELETEREQEEERQRDLEPQMT